MMLMYKSCPCASPDRTTGRLVVLAISEPCGDDGNIGPALISRLAMSPLAPGVRVVGVSAEPAAVVANWRGADTAVIVRQSHLGHHRLGTIKHIRIRPSLREAELVARGRVAEAIALGRTSG